MVTDFAYYFQIYAWLMHVALETANNIFSILKMLKICESITLYSGKVWQHNVW